MSSMSVCIHELILRVLPPEEDLTLVLVHSFFSPRVFSFYPKI